METYITSVLSLLEGHHPRFGQESPMSLLDSHLIGEIVILSKPPHPPPQYYHVNADSGYGDRGYDMFGDGSLSDAYCNHGYSSEEDYQLDLRSDMYERYLYDFIDLVNQVIEITSELAGLIESAWSADFQTFVERLKKEIKITETMESQFEIYWDNIHPVSYHNQKRRRHPIEQDRYSHCIDLVNLGVTATPRLIKLIESAWSEDF